MTRRPIAPAFTNDFIIQEAERLTKRFYKQFYPSDIDPKWVCSNFDVVYENLIYPEYEIVLIDDKDLGHDDNGEKILGKYCPIENVAYIDVSLHPSREDRRRTFTCWHEVGGHGILQGNWFRQMMRHEVITTEAC